MVWRKMCEYFNERPQGFFEHYHGRSNVETAFSTINQKFGKDVVSRNFNSQTNEGLLKILCHNICCLIQAYYENKIDTFYSTNQPQNGLVIRMS